METWTVARVLEWGTKDLKERSHGSPRLDAELMMAMVLECDRVKLIIDGNRPLEKDELGAYKALHKRRRSGEPIAYLRGFREFYSRNFHVDRRVLVPRPETELLVEAGMRRTRHVNLCARVLDVCTGSGCVAITIKKERPTNLVVAGDISTEALEVASINCNRLGALVGLFRSDLYDAFRGMRFDLITANPPYIPQGDMSTLPVDVRDFEPSIALAAAGDGLEITHRIIDGALELLAPGGVLALEVVAGRARDVAELLSSANYEAVEVDKDYGGHERIVSGTRS
jgi:release factor glutamine methyltransferase